MKIRTKIIASTLLIVSITLMLSGFFIYDYARGIIRDQSIKDSRTKLAQISFQLRKIQEQVVKTAEYIVSDEEIGALVYKAPSAQLEENYFRKQAVQDRLKRFAALNSFILNIVLVRPDGETFSNNTGFEDYFADYFKQDWFQSQTAIRSGFSAPHPFFSIGSNREVFSYILKFRPIGDHTSPFSYLVLDISYLELSNVFLQSAGDFGQIELFTASGTSLYKSRPVIEADDGAFMNRAYSTGQTFLEDSRRIVLTDDAMSQEWVQVALLSKDQLFEKINRIFGFYLIMILSGFVFSLIVMLPVILNLTKPLSRLTHAMKRVSVGDLSTSVSIRSGDELEILGTGFNRMVSELKRHISASLHHEEMKRKMQIDLLMAQINPHFVYNTLNTVIYLCHAERNRQAAEVTQSLIALLQDTIKTGDGAELAPLREEQRIVDKYVLIQQTRYPGRFRLLWEVSDELLDKAIPRMMLQPLVENAILHGLLPSEREDGTIIIRAYRCSSQLCLEIEDNGAGMAISAAGEETTGVRKEDRERTRGIGLSNIRERIAYHYGLPHPIDIESEAGAGTRVRIRLPLPGDRQEEAATAGFYTK